MIERKRKSGRMSEEDVNESSDSDDSTYYGMYSYVEAEGIATFRRKPHSRGREAIIDTIKKRASSRSRSRSSRHRSNRGK